jgi:hypothetical protein
VKHVMHIMANLDILSAGYNLVGTGEGAKSMNASIWTFLMLVLVIGSFILLGVLGQEYYDLKGEMAALQALYQQSEAARSQNQQALATAYRTQAQLAAENDRLQADWAQANAEAKDLAARNQQLNEELAAVRAAPALAVPAALQTRAVISGAAETQDRPVCLPFDIATAHQTALPALMGLGLTGLVSAGGLFLHHQGAHRR